MPPFATCMRRDWFTRPGVSEIVLANLAWLEKSRGWQVYAVTVLSNHMHLLMRSGKVLADFSQYSGDYEPAAGGHHADCEWRKKNNMNERGRTLRKLWRLARWGLVAALVVAGLAAWIQSCFFRHEDNERTDDSTADSGWDLCFAELRRRSAEAIRVQEPLRRQPMRGV